MFLCGFNASYGVGYVLTPFFFACLCCRAIISTVGCSSTPFLAAKMSNLARRMGTMQSFASNTIALTDEWHFANELITRS